MRRFIFLMILKRGNGATWAFQNGEPGEGFHCERGGPRRAGRVITGSASLPASRFHISLPSLLGKTSWLFKFSIFFLPFFPMKISYIKIILWAEDRAIRATWRCPCDTVWHGPWLRVASCLLPSARVSGLSSDGPVQK